MGSKNLTFNFDSIKPNNKSNEKEKWFS
jgi:hypothetical protein